MLSTEYFDLLVRRASEMWDCKVYFPNEVILCLSDSYKREVVLQLAQLCQQGKVELPKPNLDDPCCPQCYEKLDESDYILLPDISVELVQCHHCHYGYAIQRTID